MERIGAISPRKLRQQSAILIVEDDPILRELLIGIFKDSGFDSVHQAENGEQGLELAKKISPGLIILDMIMPVMDGFEFCRELRNMKEFERTPVLALSSLTTWEEKARIYDIGVTDCLSKPPEEQEIIARATNHLERHLMYQNLQSYSLHLEEELKSARASQEIILPKQADIDRIKDRFNVSIYQHFNASSQIGGDFWGVEPLNDTKLSFYIIDFSGHGVTAALNTFRLHTLMHYDTTEGLLSAGDYLENLNVQIVDLLPSEQYATMFYGVIDTSLNTLEYATAACPEAIVCRGDDELELIDGSGFPLGIISDATYETKTIPFKPSDGIVLYSDGFTETKTNKGDMIGEQQLYDAMQRAFSSHNAQMIGNKVQAYIDDFYKKVGDNVTDDLTLSAYFYHPKTP